MQLGMRQDVSDSEALLQSADRGVKAVDLAKRLMYYTTLERHKPQDRCYLWVACSDIPQKTYNFR